MGKEEFKLAANNFRTWARAINENLEALAIAEKLIVEGDGVIQSEGSVEQNAELIIRPLADNIRELMGGYDYLLHSLGFGPRFGTKIKGDN